MMAPAFMLTVAGFLLAALFYLWKPDLSGKARKTFAPLVSVHENKYGFDKLWIDALPVAASSWARSRAGSTATSSTAWSISRHVLWTSQPACCVVPNPVFLYHYAFAMIIACCPAGRADALPALMTCTE